MLTEVWYTKGTEEKTLAYSYEYTASGLVHQFTDHLAGKSTVYKYDTTDRLISFIEHSTDDMYNDFSSLIFYDSYDGQVGSVFYNINLTSNGTEDASGWHYSYTRDHDGLLLNTAIVTPATSGSDAYEYDDFNRVFWRTNSHTSSANSANRFVNETEYYYVSTLTYTTPLVGTYITQVNDHDALSISYDYDGNGNITRISIDGGPEIRYVYDALDQLIREDNGQLSKTFVYSYDDAGNITSIVTYPLTAAGATPSSPLSTKSYGYSTDGWGDRLTSFNGNAITYDTVGNPLTYNNGKSYSFSWTGRQMTGAVTGGASYSFTYNNEGIRTSKTRNGYTTRYLLDGSRIVGEQTANYVMIYVYDAQGSPIGLQYHDASDAADEWEVFWFEKNLQGDIIAVYDESGYLAVTYTYDAWGNCEEEFNHSTFELSAAGRNPFRYRGYYYDTSLELYLLGTRYYDPVVGRFINADKQLLAGSDLLGMNLFAYCGNNPVNRIDPTGEAWWHWAIGAAIVVACAAATVVTCGGFAAAAGAVAAVGSGIAAASTASTIAAGAFLGAATAYGTAVLVSASTSKSIDDFNAQGDWGTVAATATGAVVGGAGAYLGTKGSNTPPSTTKNKVTSTIKNDVIDLPRTGSALKTDSYHAFPDIVDNYAGYATKSSISNGTLYQLQGSLNGTAGRFEWIIQNQQVTHRMFVPGGGINGIPIMP